MNAGEKTAIVSDEKDCPAKRPRLSLYTARVRAFAAFLRGCLKVS